MLASALVTVIVAFPAVVPDFIVTVFPLILADAMFELLEETLKLPVLLLTVKLVLLGYAIVPLVADSVKFPDALFTFTVSVVVCVLYPALLAFTVTVNSDVFVHHKFLHMVLLIN